MVHNYILHSKALFIHNTVNRLNPPPPPKKKELQKMKKKKSWVNQASMQYGYTHYWHYQVPQNK